MDIGPLSGVKVVECSIWGFGPIGGLMLGDLGADVIKIESPRRPDPARHVTNVVGIEVMMEDGRSACWQRSSAAVEAAYRKPWLCSSCSPVSARSAAGSSVPAASVWAIGTCTTCGWRSTTHWPSPR